MISKSLGSSRRFHSLLKAGGKLGEFCQILFPLLVANTDDYGRMPGDAFTIKNVVLPSSRRPETDFDRALDILADVDLIDRYEAGGIVCLQVVRFDEHQINLHKRTASRIPEFPADGRKFRSTPPPIDRKVRTNVIELKGTELKGIELKRTESNQYSGEAPRTPADNVAVITKITHELLALGGISDPDLEEAVKCRCAELKIAYDSASVGKAIDSARAQKSRRVG